MDVKIAFLNGDLEEKIYIDQPEGFIELVQESKVCKLIKSCVGQSSPVFKLYWRRPGPILASFVQMA